MTSATARVSATPATPARFIDTLASEWTKLTSLRSTTITLLLGAILSLGGTALIAAVIGSTWDDWGATDRAEFDPILTAFFGSIFGGILFVVLGVNAVAADYATGMMRLTLTATPRRGRVLLAKVAIVSLVTLGAGAVVTVGMFLVGQAIFESYGLSPADLGDPDTRRAIVGAALLGPVFPVIGAALAVLLRSTAGAITTVLALLFAPAIFGPLLPAWWQENVLAYLVGPATDSVVLSHLSPDERMYLDPSIALAVVAAWLVAFVGTAYLALIKRDA
ncbi:MAG: ABC transporter permease subunit [Thermomicrobiales bacterium]